MDSMNWLENSEISSPVQQRVIQEIQSMPSEYRLKIIPNFSDLPLRPPNPYQLTIKHKDKDLRAVIGEGYNVLNSPIVDYPHMSKGDTAYDTVDKAVIDHFKTPEEKAAAQEVIVNNRMRVNKLNHALQALSLLPVLIEDQEKNAEIGKITEEVKNSEFEKYKSLSLERKRGIVKKFSKGIEMALRVLDDQKLTDEDWKTLKSFS